MKSMDDVINQLQKVLNTSVIKKNVPKTQNKNSIEKQEEESENCIKNESKNINDLGKEVKEDEQLKEQEKVENKEVIIQKEKTKYRLDLQINDLINKNIYDGRSQIRIPWEDYEDKILVRFRQKYNIPYEKISQNTLKWRTPTACKKRYIKLRYQSEEWNIQDQKLLQKLVKAQISWEKMHKYFPQWDIYYPKRHFTQMLNNRLRKDPWTLPEDLVLINNYNSENTHEKAVDRIDKALKQQKNIRQIEDRIQKLILLSYCILNFLL